MTPLVIGVLLAAGGALAGIALDRAWLRRWIRSHSVPHRRDGSIDESAGGRRIGVRQAVEAAQRRAARAETARAAAETVTWQIEGSLNALRTGLVVCDRNGGLLARNAAAELVVQARHGEALVAGALKELLERARQGEQATANVELRTEPRRSYEVEARPIERDGEMLGAVALVSDTTEQHRTEAVRRDFVANVSHELKTPIGALSLLAESLAADPGPEVAARLTDRIQIEIQRVANTIDDLLTLASLEHDSVRMDEVVEIADVVDGALDRIWETATQRGVDVVVAASDPQPTVRGSRVQLESALFNLLDNAVKFSDSGSQVDVTVARDQGRLLVSVADQGIGIPANERSRIFERFYRVDRARSRHTGGTGLGLSIVRHAVLNHGGEVSVTSREGFGATFTIALPVATDA